MALANVKVCSAVFQSPNSLLVWKRAMRSTAAYATAPATSSPVAPSRSAASRASAMACASSPSSTGTRASRPAQPPRRLAPSSSAAGNAPKACSRIATRSTGWRQAFASSMRSALA